MQHDGIVLVPRDWPGEVALAWDLRLALAGAAPAELAPEGNRITYRRPGEIAERPVKLKKDD